jgi:hypothetical protein
MRQAPHALVRSATVNYSTVRRRFFTFFSVLLLLLCVAMCVLWVRSYWRSMYVCREVFTVFDHGPAPRGRSALSFYQGHLDLLVQYQWNVETPKVTRWRWESLPVVSPYVLSKDQSPWSVPYGARSYAGVRYRWELPPGERAGYWERALSVPCLYVLVLLCVAPGLWLCAWFRRRKAARAGLCPSCGYDLRATPDRCPECGATPVAAKS